MAMAMNMTASASPLQASRHTHRHDMIAGLRARLAGCRASSTLVRREAPAFVAKAVVSGAVCEVRSQDLLGSYWVLFFYPLDLYGPAATAATT